MTRRSGLLLAWAVVVLLGRLLELGTGAESLGEARWRRWADRYPTTELVELATRSPPDASVCLVVTRPRDRAWWETMGRFHLGPRLAAAVTPETPCPAGAARVRVTRDGHLRSAPP